METRYIIYEIREVGKKVTFAGYSDGYGVEHETIYSLVVPDWAAWSYATEADALLHLADKADSRVNYEIKKIYRVS